MSVGPLNVKPAIVVVVEPLATEVEPMVMGNPEPELEHPEVVRALLVPLGHTGLVLLPSPVAISDPPLTTSVVDTVVPLSDRDEHCSVYPLPLNMSGMQFVVGCDGNNEIVPVDDGSVTTEEAFKVG